jgi:hypothetical protein
VHFYIGEHRQLQNMKKESESQNNIQDSFNASLVDSNLENLGTDFLELGIDSLLQDGLLREIPIVSTIANLSKVGANIQDRFFLKKILSFLAKLKNVPIDRRNIMIARIDASKKYRIKVGEKLLYIIDSCDDHEISELVSILFKSYIDERISYDDFLKTASVLKKMNKADFDWFIKERKVYRFDLSDIGDQISSGLFELYYDDITVNVSDAGENKPFSKERKYDTDVDGGVNVLLSPAGEIILEIFCPYYKKPNIKKM